ncbi:MAG: hypothetical protein ACJ749_05385 [Flavisolibacter sp.]
MLDPREVRAGNWVLRITGTDTNTKSFFEYKAVALDEYYFTFAKACFPIMISSLILENSGFTYNAGDWYINMDPKKDNNDAPFLTFRQSDKSWYLQKMKLWFQPVYVHQLQNLFYALVNKEINIDLGRFENISMIGPIDFFVKPLRKTSIIRELL